MLSAFKHILFNNYTNSWCQIFPFPHYRRRIKCTEVQSNHSEGLGISGSRSQSIWSHPKLGFQHSRDTNLSQVYSSPRIWTHSQIAGLCICAINDPWHPFSSVYFTVPRLRLCLASQNHSPLLETEPQLDSSISHSSPLQPKTICSSCRGSAFSLVKWE